MTKIDSRSGFEWNAEDRVDAIDTPRVFATLVETSRISDDVAPSVSSLLEDARFWEDPGTAIRKLDGPSTTKLVGDVSEWLQENEGHPQKAHVSEMFAVLQKYSSYER